METKSDVLEKVVEMLLSGGGSDVCYVNSVSRSSHGESKDGVTRSIRFLKGCRRMTSCTIQKMK